jgi:hypothetical protein
MAMRLRVDFYHYEGTPINTTMPMANRCYSKSRHWPVSLACPFRADTVLLELAARIEYGQSIIEKFGDPPNAGLRGNEHEAIVDRDGARLQCV